MKRIRKSLVAFVVSICVATTVFSDENEPKDDPDLPNVLILGDSISIGYTPYVKKLLEGKANVHRPDANCGNTKMGLANLEKWLGTRKWDVIHFNWGLWDMNRRIPHNQDNTGVRDRVNGHLSFTPEQYATNLEKIVLRLKKTEAKLIWANISFVPENEEGRAFGDDLVFNKAAAKIMKKHRIPTNDLNTLTRSLPPEMRTAPNDVHYTGKAGKKIAEQVADTILRCLDGTLEEKSSKGVEE